MTTAGGAVHEVTIAPGGRPGALRPLRDPDAPDLEEDDEEEGC
ncbi:hypothetical protein [Streptomyces subrutilus]|nr:hypothetical protein [Streptomyces subrutilus]